MYSLSDFAEKSLHRSYDYLNKNGLINPFDEVYKLCQVILTIPSNTASAERSFLALKRLHSCRRQRQGQEQMSSLSLLSIEKRLLLQLQQKQSF